MFSGRNWAGESTVLEQEKEHIDLSRNTWARNGELVKVDVFAL
jgi:hypothetical protein